MAKKKIAGSYDAEDIQLFEHVKAVQKRPGMYIGAGKNALYQLAYEIVTNSTDEIDAGYGDSVQVTIVNDGSLKVVDNGRGIPWQDTTNTPNGQPMPACVLSATHLHAGGKFGGENAAYSSSGGLNGVGMTACNALSEYFVLSTSRDGAKRSFTCQNGIVTVPLHVVEKTNKTGTEVQFLPSKNPDYFSEGTDYRMDDLYEKVKYLPYLIPHLKLTLRHPAEKQKIALYKPNGLSDYITDTYKHLQSPVFSLDVEVEDYRIRAAWAYDNNDAEVIDSFANTILTKTGGSHVNGFRTAIARTVKKYILSNNMLQGKNKDLEIEPEDCREGLKGIIAIKTLNPSVNIGFQSQTKDEITNPTLLRLVGKAVTDYLADALEADAVLAKRICTLAIAAARGRLAAKKARERERKDTLKTMGLNLPAKLKDCHSTVAENCELFIVEGDSAGGSASSGREPDYQAVLPLRGKILNVINVEVEKMLANAEIRSLISAIGAGYQSNFDLSKLRYHKVIIMTDADLDGGHIRVLLIVFFWRMMKEMVRAGHLYVATPPLYRIKKGDKVERFLLDIAALQAWVREEMEKQYELPPDWVYDPEDSETLELALRGRTIDRIKGLGEMNDKDLFETTMDRNNRSLIRVCIPEDMSDDEVEAHLQLLMGGDRTVKERKAFICEKALFADTEI